jgi:hypothetical protein
MDERVWYSVSLWGDLAAAGHGLIRQRRVRRTPSAECRREPVLAAKRKSAVQQRTGRVWWWLRQRPLASPSPRGPSFPCSMSRAYHPKTPTPTRPAAHVYVCVWTYSCLRARGGARGNVDGMGCYACPRWQASAAGAGAATHVCMSEPARGPHTPRPAAHEGYAPHPMSAPRTHRQGESKQATGPPAHGPHSFPPASRIQHLAPHPSHTLHHAHIPRRRPTLTR